MKTSRLSHVTLSFIAAAAFLFTGCDSDVASTDNTVVNADVAHSQQPVPKKTDARTHTQDPADAQSSDDAPTQAAVEPSKVSDALMTEYLDAINAARAETQNCGEEGVFDPAPALTWNNMLGNAAWEHSNDMAQSDTFDHVGSGTASDTTAQEQGLGRGSRFSERIRHHGYKAYRTIGENIAGGYETTQEVIEAWLASPHHCANLMNPKFSEVGMALVENEDAELGTYWTQEFGGR